MYETRVDSHIHRLALTSFRWQGCNYLKNISINIRMKNEKYKLRLETSKFSLYFQVVASLIFHWHYLHWHRQFKSDYIHIQYCMIYKKYHPMSVHESCNRLFSSQLNAGNSLQYYSKITTRCVFIFYVFLILVHNPASICMWTLPTGISVTFKSSIFRNGISVLYIT